MKTSVLFIDRALARRRDDVLLLKIENDGFSLNTNRNPIAENDLPAALELISVARQEECRTALATLASPLQHRLVSRADFARLDAYRTNNAAWDFCRKRHARLSKAESDLAELRAEADADPRTVTRAERALSRLREEFPADTGLPDVPKDSEELKRDFESHIKSAAIGYGDDPKAPTTLTSQLRENLDGQREYSLTLDQHVEAVVVKSQYALRRVEECLREFKYPAKIQTKAFKERGRYPIVDQSEKFIAGYTDDADFLVRIERPLVVFGDHTLALKFIDFDFCLGADGVKVLAPVDDIDPKFFYFTLRSLHIESLGYSRHFKLLKDKEIPVPTLEEQQAIVAEIEGYQRVADGCAAVLSGYRSKITPADEWPRLKLVELCAGYKTAKPETAPEAWLDYIDIGSIDNERFVLTGTKRLLWKEAPSRARKIVSTGDTLFSLTRPYLKNIAFVPVANDGHICSTGFAVLRPRAGMILPEFLFFSCLDDGFVKAANDKAGGAAYPAITENELLSLAIAVPDLETQRVIVAELMREQATLAGVAELKAKHEAYIGARLAAVWGEAPGTEIASSPSSTAPDIADAEAA